MTDFDLFNLPDDYYDSPYATFRNLRENDPIHANSDGTVLLTRYNDVRRVWRDLSASVDKNEIFAKKFGPGALFDHHTTAMLFRDPPDHDRLRTLVNPFFSPANLEQFRSDITVLVDELLDEAAERREFDFVTDFAARIPISVITRIIGIPPEDGLLVRGLGLRVLLPLNPKVSQEVIDDGNAAAAEFADYLLSLIDYWRKRGGDLKPTSVIQAVVAAEHRGEQISEQEMVQTCLLVFNGGHETTTNLMAVGTHSLLEQGDPYRQIASIGPDEMPTAIDELVRFVSPLQFQGRRTTKAVTIPSGELASGTEVVLSQASANRDPDAFVDPDRLDLFRSPNAHVSFGLGVHSCLGRLLARMEAEIMFPRLAARFPELHETGRAEFNRNARFRGLRKMPVSVEA